MNTSIADSSKLAADQFLIGVLEKSWRQYLTELKRCRTEFSNEAVHDLRTATRRAMTVIQLLNSITPRPRLEKIIGAFENQLEELDDLRDTQVVLAEISETIHEFSELHDLQRHQGSVEKRILRNFRKRIKKLNVDELSKRVRKTHHFVQTGLGGELDFRLLQAVDDAYLIAKHRLAWVDSAQPATIHQVGNAFKVFRYRVELIHPILKGFPKGNLDEMHEYQSQMSEIRDLEIFMEMLAEFSEHASTPDLDSIRQAYGRRRADALAAYIREMNQLDQFWRPEPGLPFYWDKSE